MDYQLKILDFRPIIQDVDRKSKIFDLLDIEPTIDVSAIITSIPVDTALEAVKIALEKDDSWKEITDLTADQVLQLLVFCVRTTYFVFREHFIYNVGVVLWAARLFRLSLTCIGTILKRLH